MLSSTLFVQITVLYGLLAHAQSPLQLGFIPLAVKTPYLHAWVKSGGGQSPAGVWPNIVSNDHILGWVGIIRVDNQTYQWMGDGGFNFTKTVTSEITPSKSTFMFEAGPIQFNVTFLSPIEPDDYVRQSMPFSYMYIDGITANDSQSHTVQVYSDITAEWVSKDITAQVIWNTTETNDTMYHHVTKKSPSLMVESGGISDDSTAYFATMKRPGLTWQEGDALSRNTFGANGTLTNTFDTNYRSVSPDWPVFPFSVDLGAISPGFQPDPVVWAIGLVRNPLVRDTTGGSTQDRTAYYWSNYTLIDDVISAFLDDFPGALNRSLALDNKILSAGSDVSPEYGGILSLVTRQIFASMDITVPSAQTGQFNSSDVKIFMKDIGQSRRTNPVEVLYGALPALLFFNTSLARDSLQPLLELQSSPQYPNDYAAPDFGAGYPLVNENSTDSTRNLGVENCGNMLIMVYAHAAKSGDGTLLSRYYSVLQRWADFLAENSLHPRGFITADGLNNPDMSNLALKGILGVYSMAKINEAVGVSNTTYMDQATQLIKDWKQFAIGADGHIQAVYNQTTSWGLMYNLFPAVWLQTGLIEDSILENQAQFYAQQNLAGNFGLSLDTSRSDAAYPHWTLMTAATIPDSFNTTRNQLIKSIYQQAYNPGSTSPLPVAYKSSDGSALFGTGTGSPILGAAFAVAAMQLQNVNITSPPVGPSTSPTSSHTTNNVGAIVGGVLGGLAFLLLMTAIFTLWRRRQQKGGSFAVASYNDANSILTQVSHQTNATLDRPTSTGSLPPLVVTAAPLLAQRVPVMSRKQREAQGLFHKRISTQSELPLLVLASSHSDSGSVSGEEVLREELEILRREVESIRHVTEAPPVYT